MTKFSQLIAKLLLAGLAVGLALLSALQGVRAADAVVRAVLFYSPSCGHCHAVITETLTPMIEQYAGKLEIVGIDVSVEQGAALYQATIQAFQIPEERLGVPTLIIGDTVLVGSQEIPEQFPGMVEAGLAAGGVDWPQVPGLTELMAAEPPPGEAASSSEATAVVAEQAETEPNTEAAQPQESGFVARFKHDLSGNTLAVVVLLGMLVSGGIVGYAFMVSSAPRLPRFPEWFVPVISILGLGVAFYLAYVELFQAEAVCGPVGDCNTVQQSKYAYLFGVIPIGVVGVLGYLAILIAWLFNRNGPQKYQRATILLVWGMVWIGTLFSIYLTFLEPFVIGASCIWCLTSAVIMTLLLWATTPAALQAIQTSEEDDLEAETAAL